jgi:diaminopimelate epimerase
MTLPFMKLESSGNDVLLVDLDGQKSLPRVDYAKLAPSMLSRHHGAGARFLATIEKTDLAVGMIRAYRADGAEIPARGDVLVCVGRYLFDSGRCGAEHFTLLTSDGLREIDVITAQDFRLGLGKPRDALSKKCLDEKGSESSHVVLSGGERRIALASFRLGGHWAILFSDALQSGGLEELREICRADKRAAKARLVEVRAVSNECFIMRADRDKCYDGAYAAGAVVVASVLTGAGEREALVREGGGARYVDWDKNSGVVSVTAQALYVYEGLWYLPDEAVLPDIDENSAGGD